MVHELRLAENGLPSRCSITNAFEHWWAHPCVSRYRTRALFIFDYIGMRKFDFHLSIMYNYRCEMVRILGRRMWHET